MAPRKSHLDCQETLLVQDNEEDTATEGDRSLVSVDDPPVNDMILDVMYERGIIDFVFGLHYLRALYRDQAHVLPLSEEPEAEPPESDGEADKENQDPNGRSNTQAMALAREDQLPRQDDYFDVQVVTELEQLSNTWRQFMGGALRAPQQNSPFITELFSDRY